MQRKQLTQAQLLQEHAWVKEAQAKPARFGRLYEKYYKQIFLFVYKRVGEEEIAGDLTAQVFLKAMLNLQKYTFQGVPFGSWLYRIALNEINQHFRKLKGDRIMSIESVQITEIAEEVIPDQTEKSIHHMIIALEQLKEPELALIELRFFEKLPYKEIAVILGITENNAKVRVYRILAKLRDYMKESTSSA